MFLNFLLIIYQQFIKPFYFQNGNKEDPKDIAILDWQLSSYHSPVLDVAYFLFSVSSKDQVTHFDELLCYYHTHLSHYIAILGSNPDQLFPISTFIEHWKKYSLLGIVFTWTFLEMIFYNEDDDIMEIMKKKGVNINDLFLERVLATNRYYFFDLNKSNIL